MKIGIVGYGFVGKAIETGFKSKCDVLINDPKHPKRSVSLQKMAEDCDFIFVSVPTPYKKDVGFDRSIIESVMNDLDDEARKLKDELTIIVKSAVVPSVVEDWLESFNNLNIVIMPEYLSDKDGERMFVNQKLMIIGCTSEELANPIIDLFYRYSICEMNVCIGVCTQAEAALIKYMENAFLSTKVLFMNQFFKLHQKLIGNDWNSTSKIFNLDPRLGTSHNQVPGPDGDYGFGGRCLPKDIRSIIFDGKKYGVDLSLLDFVWNENLKIRKKHDWLKEETA